MIKVYAFSTPNSVRVPIALEELGLSYEIEAINVRKGEQKAPSYLAVNPNGKFQSSSIRTGRAASRSPSPSRARSWFISRRRPGGSCPRTASRAPARSSRFSFT